MNDRFRFRIPITNKYGNFEKFVYFDLFNQPAITCRESDIFQKAEQCTGLKDASGRLIYEGDLVLLDPDDPLALVVWNEDVAMFCLVQEDVCYTFDNCGYSPQGMEVVGNSHENPELLEDK